MRKFMATHPVHADIRFDGGNTAKIEKWPGHDFSYHLQSQGYIESRMQTALKKAFAGWYRSGRMMPAKKIFTWP